MFITKRVLAVCATTMVALASQAGGEMKHRFTMNGSYVEGCSCGIPCKCELTGVEMGCEGVGAFSFDSGTFDGKSLAGVKTAYAVKPGDWVIIYVDAPTERKNATATNFMKTMLKAWGKLQAVKRAKVAVWHSGDMDYATVDGGKIMNLKSKVVKGGDGKTALVYSNINDPVHPTVMQAKTISCTFKDGDRQFTLKDSNAYFNHRIRSSGSL
jgi:hypothetical protein